jgi:hypothetical protein
VEKGRVLNTKEAIEYMRADPYRNILMKIKNSNIYAYDQDGEPRVNRGMWVSIDKPFKEDEEWRIP